MSQDVGVRQVRSGSKGDMQADMWACGVMLADALLDQKFSEEGPAANVYLDQDRSKLLPSPLAGPGVPSDALVTAVREMLALDPQVRPKAWDVLRRPGVFQAVTQAADLAAVLAGPRQRRAALDAALEAARVRRPKHKLAHEVERSAVLSSLVPMVNSMTAKQLAMTWEASFVGETGQDDGGVTVDMLTCAFDAFRDELLCCEDDGAHVFKDPDDWPSSSTAIVECMGRLVLHSLVHAIAPPLSLNPAVYASALGWEVAKPTDFTQHDFVWWSSPPGPYARGWLGWGDVRYEAYLRWLDAKDPSGRSRRRLDPQNLIAADLSFEDDDFCEGDVPMLMLTRLS